MDAVKNYYFGEALNFFQNAPVAREAVKYAETKSLEDFESVCERIELFKLVDNINENAEVYIRKAKDKPREIKPDYEYAIVYNEPQDLAFIGAACKLNPDLMWQTKYTQAVERALNYVKKYSKPIVMDDHIHVESHSAIYYRVLHVISGSDKYKTKYESMIYNLFNFVKE